MTVFSIFLMVLGGILVLLAVVESDEYGGEEDRSFYGKIVLAGLTLFFTGAALLPGKTEAEKPKYEEINEPIYRKIN